MTVTVTAVPPDGPAREFTGQGASTEEAEGDAQGRVFAFYGDHRPWLVNWRTRKD